MSDLLVLDSALLNYLALIVLALFALYAATALANNVRGAALTERTMALEVDLLRERIGRVQARREFERAQNELSWQGIRKFRVGRKVEEADYVCSFYLMPHDERPLPPFQPGQYLTFKLDLPSMRRQATRCYSLSDGPRDEFYRVSIKRAPPPRDEAKADVGKSSSNYFHDGVEEGTILDVLAPGGDFFVDMTKQTPVVLIGGGIGVTPVLSMLNAIIDSGSRREVWFFLGVRNSAEHMFKTHLEELARVNDNVHLQICYSNPEAGDVQGVDFQHQSRVGLDLFKEVLPSNNYDYYFCGPPPMMTSVYEGLESWGVPDEHIHFEAFGPATVKRVSEAHEPAAAVPVGEISITFARTEKSLIWDPAAGSLLEFAEANDIDMESGCRAGSCGTCETAVRSGEIDYLKQPNAHVGKGSCLTCIAVPKGDLTIDA